MKFLKPKKLLLLSAFILWRIGMCICILRTQPARPYIFLADLAITVFIAFLCYFQHSRHGRHSETEKTEPSINKQRELHQNLLLNQINPHFLYNTLDSIRGKSLVDGNSQVADMIEALSSFFRYNVSYRSSIVTLADELNNTNEYLKIQSFRFNDRIKMSVRIDETIPVHSCYLPKLTLQPIVENAIVHGLESMEEGGNVTIRVLDIDKYLLISVSDNGTGMNSDTLLRINAELSTALNMDAQIKGAQEVKNGIALINIQKRVKIFFGQEYGLSIYSAENAGTTVELLIPKRTSAEINEEGLNS